MRFVPRRAGEPREPAVNITPVAGGLIAASVAVHLVRLALPMAWDEAVLIHGGFAPGNFIWPDGTVAVPLDPLPWLSLFAYAFIHADALHLLINMGFVLAFATGVERRIGGARMLVFYLLTALLALAGTLIAFIANPAPVLVVGASGALSGLFAAVLWMMWAGPPARFPDRPRRRNSRPVIVAAAVFVGVNVFIGVTGLTPSAGIQGIAWEAHIAGFVAGWLLFPLFDRHARRGR